MLNRLLAALPLALALAVSAVATGQQASTPPKTPSPKLVPLDPVVTVIGTTGRPQHAKAGAQPQAWSDGMAVGVGSTFVTGEEDRLAFSIRRAPAVDVADADLFVVGPRSRVTITLAKDADPDGSMPPLEIVVHTGAYQAVVRDPSGQPCYTVRTGERVVTFDRTAAIGTYDATKDDAMYLALAGGMKILAGRRRVVVADGMARVVQDGKIKAAKGVGKPQRDFAVGLVRIDGVDVSQPSYFHNEEAVAKRDAPTIKQPAKQPGRAAAKADPKPYEYDPETNRYFDPAHGHWHAGRPPANVANQQTNQETSRQQPAKQPGLTPGLTPGSKPGSKPEQAGPVHTGAGAPTPEDIKKSAALGDGASAGAVYARMVTSLGEIILELDQQRAPISVANFSAYAKDGLYDGSIFHRVVSNFMIQGGGFNPDMSRRATKDPIANEWKNGLKNERGTVAMARLGGRADSATSQFFINVKNNEFLDVPRDGAGYAVFGKVVRGMDVVDDIRAVQVYAYDRAHTHVPETPVVIKKVEIVSREAALE